MTKSTVDMFKEWSKNSASYDTKNGGRYLEKNFKLPKRCNLPPKKQEQALKKHATDV